MAPRPKHPQERFWTKVEKTDSGCWNWTAGLTADGYGKFRIGAAGSATVVAHRAAWFFATGLWPAAGKNLCHICDNRRCVNVAHLFVGDPMDNTRDMYEKKRNRPTYGETNGQCRLSADQVAALRQRYASGGISQRALAQEFGITQPHVSRITRGARRAVA